MSKYKEYNKLIVTAYYVQQGLPEPVYEHKFHDTRRWKFDIAWPKLKIALEVEGGVFTGGRHTRGKGFVKDMEKYNSAATLGWVVVRCIPDEVCMLDTIEMVKKVITIYGQEKKCQLDFEYWLKQTCFQQPTPEAYDLAKSAWEAADTYQKLK